MLPSGFSTPNSLFSCPTATKTARPITKPSMTGLDRNWVTNPSRSIPATRNTSPVTSTNAAALAAYVPGSVASPAVAITAVVTEDASSAAVADVGPTDRCREVPISA